MSETMIHGPKTNRFDFKERGRLAHIPPSHAPAKTVGETPTLLEVNGQSPNGRILEADDPDMLEEERRLFYVALTRAKDELYMHFKERGRLALIPPCPDSATLPSPKSRYSPSMSTLTQRIVSEIEAAPEPVQAEVLDFVLFVKARSGTSPVPGSSVRIQRTPGVCGGEACVGMTRIADTVWMLEEARRSGVGDLDLLKDYPGISVFDLEAAWQYVATHHEEIDQAIRRNHMLFSSKFDVGRSTCPAKPSRPP
jgi:uncharacterized protein (DUF433 family)